VRGAQLGDLGQQDRDQNLAPVDPNLVRSQMSALQSGVTAARRDQTSSHPIAPTRPGSQSPSRPAQPAQPAQSRQQPPAAQLEQLPPVPTRRVRGAQLAELGADPGAEDRVPARDPATIGRQLAGLQAATNRASRETGRFPAHDDETYGSNA
jgi:hypothetical protein